MVAAQNAEILSKLQSDILRLQGFKPANHHCIDPGLGSIIDSFPGRSFPVGAIHEFLTPNPEDTAATSGFIAGLLSCLMGNNGISVWISTTRKVFPPALKTFGVQPDRIIFIDLKKEKDVLWVMDEALKCSALTAVVGEMMELSFTASRRLQLAVEHSKVTGFILRTAARKANPTTCISRWKITPAPAESFEDLPGIGFPSWRLELLRIRNGKPGVWNVQWMNGKFVTARDDQHHYNTTESVSLEDPSPIVKAG